LRQLSEHTYLVALPGFVAVEFKRLAGHIAFGVKVIADLIISYGAADAALIQMAPFILMEFPLQEILTSIAGGRL